MFEPVNEENKSLAAQLEVRLLHVDEVEVNWICNVHGFFFFLTDRLMYSVIFSLFFFFFLNSCYSKILRFKNKSLQLTADFCGRILLLQVNSGKKKKNNQKIKL